MAEETSTSTPPTKSQKRILAGLGIIIILGLLGLGGFFVLRLKQPPAATPTPTPILTPEITPTPTPEVSPTPTPKLTPTPKPTATPTPSPTPEPSPTPTPTPTPVPQADLYISAYSFNHPPKQGEPFTVSITIYNQGNASAGPFWWEWWATWAVRTCRERITEDLPAHGGKVVTCTYTYGGWANYTTKAVADVDNEVAESDEGNNIYTQNVVPIH